MSFALDIHQRWEGGFSLRFKTNTAAEALALTGPSGSGKSTIIQLIAGAMVLHQGRISVGGRSFVDTHSAHHLAPRHRRVGWVDQDATLFPLLDVRANLRFGMARNTQGRFGFDAVVGVLELAHLLDRSVRNLSGGERQRVALGRALLSDPALLLCDEIFAPLDEARRARLVGILGEVRSQWAVPILLVSHRLSEVESLVDEVVELG